MVAHRKWRWCHRHRSMTAPAFAPCKKNSEHLHLVASFRCAGTCPCSRCRGLASKCCSFANRKAWPRRDGHSKQTKLHEHAPVCGSQAVRRCFLEVAPEAQHDSVLLRHARLQKGVNVSTCRNKSALQSDVAAKLYDAAFSTQHQKKNLMALLTACRRTCRQTQHARGVEVPA